MTTGDPARTAAQAVEDVWRAEAASILGVLARRLGDLDRAEEALQEALAEALKNWPDAGVPTQPAGWLVTTAWRKALDRLRRDTAGAAKLALVAAEPVPEPADDDRLALIFACCHPSLSQPAQVALTLSAVSGLATEEIAAAFLVPTATLAQRLVRAKRRLREAGVRFTTPEPDELSERLPAVLAVVYLVFNEGYLTSGSAAPGPHRHELTREGLDLARQLARLMPAEPEAAGLAALLELHEARAATRFDADGHIVLLEDQDRSRWDRELIGRALARLTAAVAHNRPGPYQVQAAIAGQHAVAASFADTNWPVIQRHYDVLLRLQPSPVVRLNRAVATRYVQGPEAALAEIDAVAPELGQYRLLYATRAEILRALGRREEADAAARRALALATNPAERQLLERRLRGPAP